MRETYLSVVSKMRLSNGQIWPVPIVLDVEGTEGIEVGQKILLCDMPEKPVATPLSVCKKRDTKGLYRKAELGIIKNVTGIDDPYEVPKAPEIVLDTAKKSVKECVGEVLKYLKEERLVRD